MTNDEYAARKIMKWPEKMGGWVSPEGFVDRAFWKPSQDRNQLWRILDALEEDDWVETGLVDLDNGLDWLMQLGMEKPREALRAIVNAHKESEE